MSDSRNLLEAVAAVQAAVPTLPKDETANVKSQKGASYSYRYTTLDTIVETLRPLLAKHGLVWMTFPCRDDRGEPALRYELAHAWSGERIEGVMPLLIQQADPQGLGSALTYARRYSLCAVLNLVADADDDGQQGGRQSSGSGYGRPPAEPPSKGASEAQRRMIHALIKEHGITREQLAGLLEPMGIQLEEGWMDRLRRGSGGTGSQLIEQLQLLPRVRLEPQQEELGHDRTTTAD